MCTNLIYYSEITSGAINKIYIVQDSLMYLNVMNGNLQRYEGQFKHRTKSLLIAFFEFTKSS